MGLRGIEERGGRYNCFLGLCFGSIDDKWVSPQSPVGVQGDDKLRLKWQLFHFPHFSPSPVALFYGGHGCLSVWEELGRNSGYVAHLKVCPFCKGRSQNQLSSMFLGGEYHRSVVRSEMSYCWAVGGSLLLGEKNARRGKEIPRKVTGKSDCKCGSCAVAAVRAAVCCASRVSVQTSWKLRQV